MKKKALFGLASLLIIAIAIVATTAYFTKQFVSDNNPAKAAVFNVDVVDSDGQTIGDGKFNLGEDFYPGMEPVEVYNFTINKNDTKLPVEYSVNFTPSGELLTGDTPIALELQKDVAGVWTKVDYSTTFKPENDSESYRILASWPHGDNDIAFQGKTGNMKLEVTATQVDPEEEVEGPPYYTGAVAFKATPNGSTRKTSEKEVNFYVNKEGYKVIEINKGETAGDFETKVGNVKVVGETFNGKLYYRVYTEKEYYASESQVWRTSTVDTSVDGVVRFNAVLGPYLSIESKALYNWFTSN
ncbi:hypothetical protein [Fredinandcohnia sp. FSL W7-1320]|uniref:hypothetical protein n=1 Tax=Fredinandcohnia sp. FSL W7-1320 TaxID=2954540 RepID=UPI0030FD8132